MVVEPRVFFVLALIISAILFLILLHLIFAFFSTPYIFCPVLRPVIPSKSNRKEPRPYDTFLYKARHLIENFFAKLKQYRALATRYDKRTTNFLGGIYLASSVIWLA